MVYSKKEIVEEGKFEGSNGENQDSKEVCGRKDKILKGSDGSAENQSRESGSLASSSKSAKQNPSAAESRPSLPSCVAELDEYSLDGRPREFHSSNGSFSGPSELDQENRSVGSESCLAERLVDSLRGQGDGDLLLQQTNRENGMLQWLQALDLQVMGACRAYERLKPMLKLNGNSGAAEDRFLAHLSQHFEAPEVGMLARCLCIPLVSIRVGKVIKQSNLLCPTGTSFTSYMEEGYTSYCLGMYPSGCNCKLGNWGSTVKWAYLMFCYGLSIKTKKFAYLQLYLNLENENNMGAENSIRSSNSPTVRGHLNLTLLPSSDLRLSFAGDDGCTERLALLSSHIGSSSVTIEAIPADTSGRSFLIKLPSARVSYYWISEKSKLIGIELLTKMKDLLMKKPSIAQLTGICESRLDCFASHLRSYLLGSTSMKQGNPITPTAMSFSPATSEPSEPWASTQFSSTNLHFQRPSHSCVGAAQLTKSQQPLYQGSLSPRTNTFQDCQARNLSAVRTGVLAREKPRCHGDGFSALAAGNDGPDPSALISGSVPTSASPINVLDDKLPESGMDHRFPPLGSELSPTSDIPSRLTPFYSFSQLSFQLPVSQIHSSKPSLLSPYYCWCPPCTPTLQYTVTPAYLPSTSVEPFSLPPLSSFIPTGGSSSAPIQQIPPLNLADVPAFLSDPLVRFPLPVTSFITVPGSQQIPKFTPFMSDPIVHVPVIDVCSSGQGYLVSAGPTITTTISPLLPNLVNSLVPEAESVVEKGARETLRLLIGSTQNTSTQLMEVLPAVLTSTDESLSHINGLKQSTTVAGSRGLYTGLRDVDALANSFSAVGLFGSFMSSVRAVTSNGGPSRQGGTGEVDGADRFEGSEDHIDAEGSGDHRVEEGSTSD